MQTISLYSRVFVAPAYRIGLANDDEFWSGTITKYCGADNTYAVLFDTGETQWYTLGKLRAIEPKQLAPVPYCRHGTHPNTPCGACESDD